LPVARAGSIGGYLDDGGVLHIVNAEPKDPKPINLSLRQDFTALPAEPASDSEREKGLPIRQVLRPKGVDKDSAPGTPPRSKSREQANLREGSIRRYRDAKGVLHIESVEPPPLTQVQAIPGIISKSAAVGSGLPQPAGGSPQPQAPSGSRVIAFRDKKGRLTIRNLDPGYQAEKPNPALALTNFEPIIIEAALSYSLPVHLIHALIKAESNFVPRAVSPKGAMGLMQLMPGTADSLGVRDPFCPRENILAGCRYLRILLNCFHDNLPLALAAYNAGYQRVINAGYQVPNIRETQDFVTQVLSQYYTMMLAIRPSGTWSVSGSFISIFPFLWSLLTPSNEENGLRGKQAKDAFVGWEERHKKWLHREYSKEFNSDGHRWGRPDRRLKLKITAMIRQLSPGQKPSISRPYRLFSTW
jgi:Transglycosylase SLT domain